MTLSEQQKQAILNQQSQKNTTKRVVSPKLEEILYEAVPVLDHGFVRVVDYMGDDSSIVQAARVSYGKGTKKVSILEVYGGQSIEKQIRADHQSLNLTLML